MTNNKLQSCHSERLTASVTTGESDVTLGLPYPLELLRLLLDREV